MKKEDFDRKIRELSAQLNAALDGVSDSIDKAVEREREGSVEFTHPEMKELYERYKVVPHHKRMALKTRFLQICKDMFCDDSSVELSSILVNLDLGECLEDQLFSNGLRLAEAVRVLVRARVDRCVMAISFAELVVSSCTRTKRLLKRMISS